MLKQKEPKNDTTGTYFLPWTPEMLNTWPLQLTTSPTYVVLKQVLLEAASD